MDILKSELPNINILLGFLGYSAKINSTDSKKLNIYDEKGNFYKEVTTHFNLEFKFINKNCKLIEYTIYDNKHTMDLGYIKIVFKNINNSTSLRINIYDAGILLAISDLSIDAEIATDNMRRYVAYTDYLTDITASMIETDSINGPHDLVIGKSGISSNKRIIPRINQKSIMLISKKIITNPRNKELINFVVDEIEKELPGSKDFINCISLYKTIMDSEYTEDEITSNIIEKMINNNCDLPQKGIEKKKV